MCSVSFVGTEGYQKWYPNVPTPNVPYIYPQPPAPTITFTKPQPTTEEWEKLAELVRKARLYDKIKGKQDCVKPDIDAWLLEVEERLGKIEEELEKVEEMPTADQLADALRIGLADLGFSLEGFEEEL